MSRKGFWFGVLVGAIVMGLLAATVGFALMRFRGSAVGIYGLREREFGINPRGWFHPGMPGRWHVSGLWLCGLPLFAGALVLAAILTWLWRRRHRQEVPSRSEPTPVVAEGVKAAPPADVAQSKVVGPPVDAGPSEAKS